MGRPLEVLDELDEYLTGREDVIDGDYGVPDPNEEMVLLRELRTVRADLESLIDASKDAAWILGLLNGMTKLPEVNEAIDRELAPLVAVLSRMEAR
jgi:hypothetical protein